MSFSFLRPQTFYQYPVFVSPTATAPEMEGRDEGEDVGLGAWRRQDMTMPVAAECRESGDLRNLMTFFTKRGPLFGYD